jgi:hypothetical protein
MHTDPHWRDYIPFHEYFHGDTGAGVGASHQTGWTSLVANLIREASEHKSTDGTGGGTAKASRRARK